MRSAVLGARVRALLLADIMLLAVAVLWGTSYGVAKQTLAYYPVLGFLVVRFGITFLILLPAFFSAGPTEGRNALRAGLPLGGILLAIFLCETFGVALTRASNAAFLISLCVVFTPFVEWLVLRARPDATAFVMVGVSLTGALLLTQGGSHGGVNLDYNLGDALILLAAVLRAFMVVMTKRLTLRRPAAALPLTTVQSGVVCFGSLAAIALFHPDSLPALPNAPAFWLGTLYLVLFCTVFAFFAQNYAVPRCTPTRVALLMGSEPAFGALFAVFWLHETLSAQGWFGGMLIVGVALWTALPRQQPAPKPIPIPRQVGTG
ncbi:MAG TPA: DMT family transporter, partial [Burkholderiaceae bacterium]|nr:DMT family transporter [Burkholderiaceae bacterium]